MSRAVKPGAIDWDVFFRKDDSSLQALLRKSPSLLEMILFIPLCLRVSIMTSCPLLAWDTSRLGRW